jgi:hypothetical protein
MRNPRLNRWQEPSRLEGLLLFAQRIEEMLFDYTLDTYKTPALNTHTRAIELRNSVREVQSGGLNESSLKSMVEELAHSINCDSVARHLIEPYTEHFKESKNWSLHSAADLAIDADLVLSRLARCYRQEITAQLRRCIEENKQKQLIFQLTTNWVVELLNQGFSRDYIFFKARSFFFGLGGPSIQSITAYDDFVDFFNTTPQEWELVFRASKSYSILADDEPEDSETIQLSVSEDPPVVQTQNKRVRDFLQRDADKLFLVIKCTALDARSARERAIGTLQIMTSFVQLHVHRTPFELSDDCIVLGGALPVHLKRSPAAILKHAECSSGDLPSRLARTAMVLGKSGLPKESVRRLGSALEMHSAALSSPSIGNQLVSLWAAIEALLPMAGAETKIARIADFMVPILSRSYPAKLLKSLDQSLARCIPKDYEEAKMQISNQWSSLEQLAAIITIKENEPIRDKLYAAIDSNVLLRFRIWKLMRIFSDSSSIMAEIKAHEQRVGWHLRRIYRSRNLLVHSGKVLRYQDHLVESLHSYVDRSIYLVEEIMMRKPSPQNLDSALMAIRLDHEAHLRSLAANKNIACNVENFREFVFGLSEQFSA